jgi:streptogrisin C
MRRVLTRFASLAVTAGLTLAVAAPAQAAPASGNTKNDAAIFVPGAVPVRAAPTSAGTFRVTGTGRSARALDDAEMQDLAMYAKKSGRELSAVVAAHQGIHEFSAYTTKLEETRPDMFVRAGLATAGGPAAYWIQFTAKPSADIVAELERLPVNTEVQYGAPASSKELARLAYALTKSLAARPDVIRSVGTRYDHERHVLRLQYAPVGGTQLSTLGSVFQKALTAGTIGGQLPIDVVPELDGDRVAKTEATVQGGRDLNLASNGDAECTAGFTVVRYGNRGVLTARHCPDALKYGTTSGIISTNPGVSPNDAIDFQFHRTLTENGHSTNAQFRATSRDASGDRTVLDVANAPMGSVVCHWGRTSTYSCSTVADTDTCKTFYIGSGVWHQYCGLDVTEDDVSAPGDSGGPWFFGSTARGGHTGGDGVESYFTRIGRVAVHLDATVLQN